MINYAILTAAVLTTSLAYAQERRPANATNNPPVVQMPRDVFATDLPEAERIREIAENIGAIELQAEQLASDVQRIKQKAIEDANINNNVRIEVHLPGSSDEASIRQMRIKIDGYEVYTVDDSAGLWLPSNAVPVFSGPIAPGDHELDIDASVTLKMRDKLPLHATQNRHIKQKITLNVPEGQVNKRWRIDLKPGKTADAPSTASAQSNEAT